MIAAAVIAAALALPAGGHGTPVFNPDMTGKVVTTCEQVVPVSTTDNGRLWTSTWQGIGFAPCNQGIVVVTAPAARVGQTFRVISNGTGTVWYEVIS
jgi:hypothetical protein